MKTSSPDKRKAEAEGPDCALPTPEGATPMMAQYIEIKSANADCLLFYHMGDFYELFFEDAAIASRVLGITLTHRGKHQGADIPMCGVPIHAATDYLHKLIAAGHRVAVCEQMEDPAEAKKRGSKSVVKRAVQRLVTPGTLTEESLLDPRSANLLVALALQPEEGEATVGLAALDISTGAFSLTELRLGQLSAEIARLEPAEIILSEADAETLAPALSFTRAAITGERKAIFEGADAERRLARLYGVASLEGFGAFTRAELRAAAAAADYLEATQVGRRPLIARPRRDTPATRMRIDATSRASLELTRTLSGNRAGSLIAAIDRTVTGPGARLLSERVTAPSLNLAEITATQDALAFLLDEADLRAAIIGALKTTSDIERALARLALARGGPRDLLSIRQTLEAVGGLVSLLGDDALPEALETVRAGLLALPHALAATLTRMLDDSPPLIARDGGFIRAGAIPELDEARSLRDDTRQVIAALSARYSALTGVKALKLRHNNVIGYYVEVPAAHAEALTGAEDGRLFFHRQTMAGAMRFSTDELAGLESKIASAAARALALELEAFDELAAKALEHQETLRRISAALAALDVLTASAVLAEDEKLTRPVMRNDTAFAIKGGRHLVVEAALRREGKPFIANDVDLGHDAGGPGAIRLVTGPNMGGKSTFLRQNALIAVMAQAGLYVPADSAVIGLVDQLFSRVGASDDLARGRSTFMVEMVETAAILNQAGERALVILDEIGRGTATYDGLSIALASVEHLHDVNRSRALFATHYHELTGLSERLARVANLTMSVKEWKGDVVFLHEVKEGAADRSYGVQVARLAGLPESVIARARTVLEGLESGPRPKGALDDLPLFNLAPAVQRPGEDPKMKALREALAMVDPDSLTPRAALETLYQLRSLMRD